MIPIPSLTGLRFIAAFTVVLAHTLPSLIPFAVEPSWYSQMRGLSAMGMTLFFVLSGFVIQYNYSAQILQGGVRGVINFFLARFARLYPLYAVAVSYQLLLAYSYSSSSAFTASALPYYVFLVQTWLYQPIGNYGLIHEFGVIPAVAWSISTEWFFYCAYPLIGYALNRMSSIKAKVWLAVGLSAFILSVIWVVTRNVHWLDVHFAQWFGVVKEKGGSTGYNPLGWVIYFSPYSRIFEFILGCICASIYMSMKPHVSPREERLGLVVLIAAILETAFMQWQMFLPGQHSFVVNLHMCYGLAPGIAVILFCCARYRNFISRLLSSWPLVLCGEASYSLYLWHMVVVHSMRWEAAKVTSNTVLMGDVLRTILAVAMMIGMSLVSWRVVEVPARRWLRNLLFIRPRQPEYALHPDDVPQKEPAVVQL